MPPTAPVQSSPPAFARLIEMGSAYWVSKTLYAAAELGIADHLANGPRRADDIATDGALSAPHVRRLLRTLAGLGIVRRVDDGRFALTDLGEALRSDAPGGAHATIMCLNSAWFSGTFDRLASAVRTGRTATEDTLGGNVFDFLAAHPEEAALFTRTMAGFHGQEPPAVAEAYDFSHFDTIVDVGGASGTMLAAILGRYSRPRGILFDLPHVAGAAPHVLQATGVDARVDVRGGDFFASVPAGGDCYLLSHVLHDWPIERCHVILEQCRRAMRPSDRLLVIETIVPDGDEMHPSKLLDMTMLAIVGGQERTADEYERLLADGGFSTRRIVPTASAVSIVEAEPATDIERL